jgi:hypothetical protein
MPNTTNFNWPTPADTDLVKDGAAAIRNLGDGVDTSLVDLKGGTTGQILSKASDTDMDFAFITPNVGDLTEVQAGTGISVADGTGPIPIVTNTVATEFDAVGDLVVGTGSDTFDRLAVGTDGFILQADSSVSPQGLKWAVDPVADVITTAGDLIYGTAADTVARLGIGTVGQVLQVNSGATAPEWATASAGAMTKITSGTFTNSGGVAINNCFTSTYINYVVILSGFKVASTNQTLFLQMQTATSTVYSGSEYYGGVFQVTESATTAATGNSAVNKWTLGTSSSTARQNITINFSGVGNTSENANYSANGNLAVAGGSFAGGIVNNDATYTGLYFTGTGNISGRYAIYGLEN